MATYEELRSLFSQTPLTNRIEVAVLVKAREVLILGSPAGTVTWATDALTPSVAASEARRMLSYLLGGAVELTIADILALSDEDLQEAVDDAVESLYP